MCYRKKCFCCNERLLYFRIKNLILSKIFCSLNFMKSYKYHTAKAASIDKTWSFNRDLLKAFLRIQLWILTKLLIDFIATQIELKFDFLLWFWRILELFWLQEIFARVIFHWKALIPGLSKDLSLGPSWWLRSLLNSLLGCTARYCASDCAWFEFPLVTF